MLSEDELRGIALDLVDDKGVNQKVLAGRMDISSQTLRRWMDHATRNRLRHASYVGLLQYAADLCGAVNAAVHEWERLAMVKRLKPPKQAERPTVTGRRAR